MYGLAYCKLDYEYMMDMNLDVLTILFKAEIDKELHQHDLEMMRTAWQTSYLMNATGNYKTAVKPEKLYTSIREQGKKPARIENVEVKREELLKTFGIEM